MYVGLYISGHNACPTCGPSLVTKRPDSLHKVIYPNNHCFLPQGHNKHKAPTNGKTPLKLMMKYWATIWEEHHNNNPPCPPPKGMSRYSIFLRLPYWKDLKIQHLLDSMHIIKNVAQTPWDHIIGKKDSLGVREDLRLLKRLPTSATPRRAPNGKIVLPKAPWMLDKVKGTIASIRTPTGYMRSLKGAFTKAKKGGSVQLYGLKSHDWHKMLHVIFILPILSIVCVYDYHSLSLPLIYIVVHSVGTRKSGTLF
ncbi:hypothetical protein GOP47_0003289 [Adiantum capillus-veneris]|uniref:Uncharacterized protein n=1 Tax=Adiantum capillus-veneris TaxID=13818 RepID=A0A9D4ZRP7_ADICA|nr:hypothetical protein GOP47_0003289 [Adiantum capillus-veneris]